METTELISTLLQEIAAEEKALHEKRLVVEFLRARLPREVRETGNATSATQTTHVQANLEPPRLTLTQLVMKAIEEIGDREFVIGDVYSIMRDSQAPMPPNDPKSKITTVLARLTETGSLIRTFKGAGNVPNRYRRVPPGKLADDMLAELMGAKDLV